MSQTELPAGANVVPSGESIDLVVAGVRYYQSLKRRKWVVMACLTLSMIAGGIYYVTATRLYQSRAELIILQTGGNVLKEDDRAGGEVSSQMPNFERVLQSDNVLKDALRALPKEHRIDFANIPGDQWLQQFRKQMSASTLRSTNVIAVSFRSVRPETAYAVVEALLSSYLSFMNTMHQDATQDLLKILAEEKVKAEKELRDKEMELLNLKRSSQVLFDSGDQPKNVQIERVIELNKALVEAKKQTVDAESLWRSIENAVRNGEDLQEFAAKLSEHLATRILEGYMGMGSQDAYMLARIQSDLIDTQAELHAKEQTLGINHPHVQELRNRVEMTRQYLEAQPRLASEAISRMSEQELGPRLVAIARRRYELAANHEAAITRQYNLERDEALRQGHQLAQIQLLENEVREMRIFYNTLLEAIKNKSLTKESGIRAKTITPPTLDRRPVTPKLSLVIALGLISGLGMGGMLVYVLDFIDDRFHSPDDLRQTIGAPILAMVRKLPPLAPAGLDSLYPFAKPNSVESEAFRSLRTAIDFSPNDLRRLTISSTEPSDGKTTVLASLAVAFAQAGKRTLLIDGDMRRPGLTKLFELSARPGLSNILKGEAPIAEMARHHLHRTKLDNLDVIPSGPKPVNPVELLAGDRLAELVAWAESHYDQLLIDAPPSLAVADVQVIGRCVDAAILTVRPDRNRRKLVIRAAEALTALGCPLFGIVVNHVEAGSNGDYGYGYGYGYGEEGYGHEFDIEEEQPTVAHRRAA